MIGRILLIILYLVVILIGLAVAILLLCGMKLYCVETGSMEPDYPIGSMVVVERVWFESLKEGDVITYVVSDNAVVTHRVVGVDPEHRQLTTKGDNNTVTDASPVSYENVLGRVNFCVPGFGYVFLFLDTRFGKIMLGIFAFSLVGFYIIKRMYYKVLDEEEAENSEEEGSKAESGEDSEKVPEQIPGTELFELTDDPPEATGNEAKDTPQVLVSGAED